MHTFLRPRSPGVAAFGVGFPGNTFFGTVFRGVALPGLTLPGLTLTVLLLGLLSSSATALAQDAYDEDALFGGSSSSSSSSSPSPADPSPADPSPADSSQARPDEAAIFGDPTSATGSSGTGQTSSPTSLQNQLFSGNAATTLSSEVAPSDPLKLGGQLYMRLLTSLKEEVEPLRMSVSAPSLLDLYLDARPNDRVRGMAVGRLSYNPIASASSFSSFGGPNLAEPQTSVALTQLWMRFDLARTVFVTAGRQHIKWGTGRFWNPTDYLQPVRRDPLEPFDVRAGVPMIKLHVPWEATGWNFYAVAVFDSLLPVAELDRTGGALRAELLLGPAEVGIDALFRRYHNPRYGLDVSSPIGPLDAYGELGLKSGHDKLLWRQISDTYVDDASEMYEQYAVEGLNIGFTGGLSYSHIFNDNDSLTVGLEYFFNSLGYDDAALYPWLIFQEDFTPFYLGQHYLALFAMLSGPGRFNDTNFTLSTLGNLSDRSFLTRLDVSSLILTHLRIEGYGAVHAGQRGGELRLGFETDPLVLDGQSIPALSVPAPVLELGASLRIAI